ncbi:MAG: hypothetical protein HY955_06730 [Deltaproteobacteria bacterium]|nr:hypothetical protein [Deltaproteobacteria bacterium]
MKLIFKVIPALLVSYLLSASFAHASSHIIIFTGERLSATEGRRLNCGGKLRALVKDVSGKGEHTLEARWIGPEGKVRQYSRQKVVVGAGPVDALVWLEFDQAPCAEEPAGFSDAGAIKRFGHWKVEVSLDSRLVESAEFVGSCC